MTLKDWLIIGNVLLSIANNKNRNITFDQFCNHVPLRTRTAIKALYIFLSGFGPHMLTILQEILLSFTKA